MNRKQRQCHDAMTKAFSSLREKNLPDDWAASVGVTIYQFHYPTASRTLAMEKATSLLLEKSNTHGVNDKLKKINPHL